MKKTPNSQRRLRAAGKGDWKRPGDESVYGQNYDEIFRPPQPTPAEDTPLGKISAGMLVNDGRRILGKTEVSDLEASGLGKIRQAIEDGVIEFRKWVYQYERAFDTRLNRAETLMTKSAFMAGRGSK